MAYSIIEQYSRDIDYFFKDTEKLIHVASAGGRLPPIIVENDYLNELIAEQRNNFLELNDIEINPNLNEIINFNTDDDRNNYLEDFIFMAKCGFYSYDKTILGDFENNHYHLVAWPKNKSLNKIKYNSLNYIDYQLNISPKNSSLDDITKKDIENAQFLSLPKNKSYINIKDLYLLKMIIKVDQLIPKTYNSFDLFKYMTIKE